MHSVRASGLSIYDDDGDSSTTFACAVCCEVAQDGSAVDVLVLSVVRHGKIILLALDPSGCEMMFGKFAVEQLSQCHGGSPLAGIAAGPGCVVGYFIAGASQ